VRKYGEPRNGNAPLKKVLSGRELEINAMKEMLRKKGEEHSGCERKQD